MWEGADPVHTSGMWFLLACTAAEESLPKESVADSGDSGEVPATATPWEEADFWTDPGPLQPLMVDPQDPPGPEWEVRIATSDDGQTWVAEDRLIARGMSSLHLLITNEGLIINGVLDRRHLEGIGLDLPSDALYAIVTADLETWGSHSWPIDGASYTQSIDPLLYWNAEGQVEAAWFGTSADGDPAQQPGPHPIMGGIWDGRAFVEDGPLWEEDGLADPSICVLDGKTWLFATQDASRVVAATAGDGRSFEATELAWGGPTVPFCWEEVDHLMVLAQTTGGAQPPELLRVNADGSSEAQGQFWDRSPFPPEFGNSCTSPVVGQLDGLWVFACAMSRPG